jgi:hypothetical protein
LGVHLPLDLTPLTRRSARVEHDLRVGPGEDDDPDDPSRVPEHTAPQQRRLEIDRVLNLLSRPSLRSLARLTLDNDGGVESEHVDVRRLAVDSEAGSRAGEGGSEVGELGHAVTGFEVGLAVEVLGLDVGDVFLFRGRADDDVWEGKERAGREGKRWKGGRNQDEPLERERARVILKDSPAGKPSLL